MLVWGFFVSTVLLYHGTFTINSLAHRWGKRRYATADNSRNNFWLALLTLGEGWHNNHHHYPVSVKQGFYWWEIDMTYYSLRFMAMLGLVWDLKPVPVKHSESLAWLKEKGLELPMMYKLGYQNNNCVGCVKGGMGYWNAIRVDFPEAFEKTAKLERRLQHAILKDKDGPVYLDELDPNRGNFKRDQPPACGFTCEWEQQELL